MNNDRVDSEKFKLFDIIKCTSVDPDKFQIHIEKCENSSAEMALVSERPDFFCWHDELDSLPINIRVEKTMKARHRFLTTSNMDLG